MKFDLLYSKVVEDVDDDEAVEKVEDSLSATETGRCIRSIRASCCKST